MSRGNKPVWREWLESLLIIAALAVVIRSFVVAPFKIPSTSMVPTLEIGDYLFVLRYPYGFRIPFTDMQILSKQANRGDVAVFVYPEDKSKDYIKRVIGVPGDKIVFRDNHLLINGKEIPVAYKGKRAYYMADGSADISDVYDENLDGIQHQILRRAEYNHHIRSHDGEWSVPEGHYFVLGDNRGNSTDSRWWGFVPQSYMVGRAAIVWWSWDSIKGTVRWDRLGKVIE